MFVAKNIDGTTPWDVAKNPNSCMLEYAGGESVANMLDAIEAFITAHGWTLHDASAGTNARAYKSLCQDGLTYKHIVIDANTSDTLFLKCYETWNETTHAGTNLCYRSDNASYAQRFNLLNAGQLYLFSHARWLAALSDCTLGIGSSSGSALTGVFETEYGHTGDIPSFLWASLYRISQSSSSSDGPLSPYRNHLGETGAAASGTGIYADFASGGYNFGGASAFYQWCHVHTEFSSGRKIISNARIMTKAGFSTPFGFSRICGLKMLNRFACGSLDEMSVTCDADYFLNPAGIPTGHWGFIETGANVCCALPK